MKTSKTIVYALSCIQELARRTGEFVQVSEIALAQNIPAAYCQKVLFSLAKAGIVLSAKGQGFCLLQDPQAISTLRVMQAVAENPSELSGEAGGAARNLGERFTAKINDTLSKLTVAEVLFAAR